MLRSWLSSSPIIRVDDELREEEVLGRGDVVEVVESCFLKPAIRASISSLLIGTSNLTEVDYRILPAGIKL